VSSLRCAECGRPLVRRRGALVHASRGVVAACDLDSDHAPVPDWAGLGEVPCRRCGAPSAWRAGAFAHVDPAHDAGHDADPELPAA
jgi:hypothetical protein